MIRIHAAARLALAALFAAGDLVAFRQSATPPTATSLTPGSVALLANTGNAAAVEQLRVALTHEDALVRAVGARVAGIARARGLAAIKAVSRWLFRPTLFNAEPVADIMTVTVNFILR